jgi:hypothetical protein
MQRQQDSTVAQERHNAARLAYERLLADKNAVDVRLSKAGEWAMGWDWDSLVVARLCILCLLQDWGVES